MLGGVAARNQTLPLDNYVAAKRIDTLAVAITAGMTAEELLVADLAYAPPFSSVWDPLATAARSQCSHAAAMSYSSA